VAKSMPKKEYPVLWREMHPNVRKSLEVLGKSLYPKEDTKDSWLKKG
jgi:hypothetical protein